MAAELRATYQGLVPEAARTHVLSARRRVRRRAGRLAAPLCGNDLGLLARAYGTDKAGPLHRYTPVYERHLRARRRERIVLLEIGIGGEHDDPSAGGASLRMWRRWFPRAQIHGADLFDKSGVAGRRIAVHRTDQSDATALRELATTIGPCDVVIDDGSHVCDHVIRTFQVLFPVVRPGGTYVIEDLQTSYLPRYGGRPRGTGREGTATGFIADLIDGLHDPGDDDEPGRQCSSYADRWIASVHVYPEMAVIEKRLQPRAGRGT
jgi:hypothetical protein